MVSLNYPECKAKEVDSGTPRAVYVCGSSDYAQRDGTFEKGFDCFYRLRITNEKERSKWMDERMAKGYSFFYLKNETLFNILYSNTLISYISFKFFKINDFGKGKK